jgi:hypothetical protein
MTITGSKERVIGEAEEKRSLFHDLENRVLDRWSICVGQRIKV